MAKIPEHFAHMRIPRFARHGVLYELHELYPQPAQAYVTREDIVERLSSMRADYAQSFAKASTGARRARLACITELLDLFATRVTKERYADGCIPLAEGYDRIQAYLAKRGHQYAQSTLRSNVGVINETTKLRFKPS